jgi:hypothetical protein|tara:strand:- start:13 stop:129 length:117 start_codon:yes stop_codon:yes gene_type:complete
VVVEIQVDLQQDLVLVEQVLQELQILVVAVVDQIMVLA